LRDKGERKKKESMGETTNERKKSNAERESRHRGRRQLRS